LPAIRPLIVLHQRVNHFIHPTDLVGSDEPVVNHDGEFFPFHQRAVDSGQLLFKKVANDP
jgi:hypothetical protein